MRPGEARPGQRVGLLATDVGQRLEGFFLFEEGDECIIAVAHEPFAGEHPDEAVALDRPDGPALGFFFISVATQHVLGRLPASWQEDFVPAVPANRTAPTISQLMAAYDSRSTAVASGAEEEAAEPEVPRLPAFEPGLQTGEARRSASRQVAFGPSARSAASALSEAARVPTASLAGAGLGRRQTSRLASLYAEEYDEDDAEDGFEPPGPPPRGPASSQDDPVMQLVQQGARVDPQLLASLEVLKLIREMRDDDRRRRAEETNDDDLFGSGRAATSLGKAMAGMVRHRARIKEQPRKIVDEFRSDAMLELNIRAGEPWAYPDLAKRISWGHFQGLQRCYLLFANVLDLLDQGQSLQAQALTCQSMKAVHQCVLNNGSWKLGWPLTGLQDPLQRRKFAGSAAELELMADFIRAEDEVEKKSRNPTGNAIKTSDGEEDEDAKAARAKAAKAKAAAAAKKKRNEASGG